MKGLLIKDFRLLKAQRTYFLTIGVIAAGMGFLYEEISFVQGFMTVVLSQFAAITVSYDEYDNGFAFLFTLPVSRRMYVLEKYVVGVILAGSAWLLSSLLALTVTIVKGGPLLETLMGGCLLLPAALVMQAVLIPFQLRFGGEKSRIALVIAAAGIIAVIVGAGELAGLMGLDLDGLLQGPVSGGWMAAGTAVLFLAGIGLSIRVSIRIMEKKEF